MRELLDVLDQRVGALVEQRVEALDVGLAVDAGRFPLAFGAAQLELPPARGQLVPVQWIDQLAVALGAHSSAAAPSVSSFGAVAPGAL